MGNGIYLKIAGYVDLDMLHNFNYQAFKVIYGQTFLISDPGPPRLKKVEPT